MSWGQVYWAQYKATTWVITTLRKIQPLAIPVKYNPKTQIFLFLWFNREVLMTSKLFSFFIYVLSLRTLKAYCKQIAVNILWLFSNWILTIMQLYDSHDMAMGK